MRKFSMNKTINNFQFNIDNIQMTMKYIWNTYFYYILLLYSRISYKTLPMIVSISLPVLYSVMVLHGMKNMFDIKSNVVRNEKGESKLCE